MQNSRDLPAILLALITFAGTAHAQTLSDIYHQQAFVLDDAQQFYSAMLRQFPPSQNLKKDEFIKKWPGLLQKLWISTERQAVAAEPLGDDPIFLEQARRQACDTIIHPTSGTALDLMNVIANAYVKGIKPKPKNQDQEDALRFVHRYQRDRTKLEELARCAALDAAAAP